MDSSPDLAQLGSLNILRLSAPLLDHASTATLARKSTGSSSSATENQTPALLAADLAHYRDLFSKLRFSYVEQVTKERFLRSITSAEPEFVDAAENVELEAKLKDDKAALKERKEEVARLVEEIEKHAQMLVERYEILQDQRAELEILPPQVTELRSTLQTLQQSQPDRSSNPDLALPLQPTLTLLSSREEELSELDAQIAALQTSIPAKREEAEHLRDELAPLQVRKIKAVQEAQEARRRRGNGGGVGDEIEERGRWLRGVETGLRTMLEV